jgi:hypothetical protein
VLAYFDADFLSSVSDEYSLVIPPTRTKHILEPLLQILDENDVRFLLGAVRIRKDQFE